MTTPEPLLELTKEERAWVGRFLRDKIMGDRFNLISILLRVEAGRRQALFNGSHRLQDIAGKCQVCWPADDDPRHTWTPADWLEKVEREVKGE